MKPSALPGFRLFRSYLDRPRQEELADLLRRLVAEAPLFTPLMPRTGHPFSVRMTNLGPLGWVSDRSGYRYQSLHPDTGRRWPEIPEVLLDIWRDTGGYAYAPEACLVNYYCDGAKMGLHRDADEKDFAAPVVSISLGNTAVFRLGGTERGGRTQSLKLASGDVLVMGGSARLAYHGVDRIMIGTSSLLIGGGRLNLTLRRVSCPVSAAPLKP